MATLIFSPTIIFQSNGKVLSNQFYPEAFLLLFYRRNIQVSCFGFPSLWLLRKILDFVYKNDSTNLKDSHSQMEGKGKQKQTKENKELVKI